MMEYSNLSAHSTIFMAWCYEHGYYFQPGPCPVCRADAAATERLAAQATDETPTGWLCPRCKAVNAPHLDQCPCAPPGD